MRFIDNAQLHILGYTQENGQFSQVNVNAINGKRGSIRDRYLDMREKPGQDKKRVT